MVQNNLFAASNLIDTVPNLLLIVTFTFGFLRGKTDGMLIGFLSGLLLDSFFGETLGFYHRAGSFLRSEHPLDARARVACSVAPVTFSVLHTKCVPSRRSFFPFCGTPDAGGCPRRSAIF